MHHALPLWLFVLQLGTFFVFSPMWFDMVWKTCAAQHDWAPNLLASDTHSSDSMSGTSCLWYLSQAGLQSVLSDLVCLARAGFWLLCVGTVTVLQWLPLGPWPIERQHIYVPVFKMQVFKKDSFCNAESPLSRGTQQSQDFSSCGEISAEVGLCFNCWNTSSFFCLCSFFFDHKWHRTLDSCGYDNARDNTKIQQTTWK